MNRIIRAGLLLMASSLSTLASAALPPRTGHVPGDFNGDGQVAADDLGAWESAFAADFSADADVDGDSDGADFLAWQRRMNVAAAPTTSAVPETGAGRLLALGAGLLIAGRVICRRVLALDCC